MKNSFKKLGRITIFLALLCSLVTFNTTQAEVQKSQNTETKVIEIATVNVYNPRIISQENNKFKIGFFLYNKSLVQSGVKYSIDLVKRIEREDKTVFSYYVYKKQYEDVLTLNPDEEIYKEVEYIVPEWYKGEYEIWVSSANNAGVPLGHMITDPKKVTLNGNGKYISIDSPNCYLTVKEDVEVKKYFLSQGVDVSKSENIILHCQIENNFSDTLEITPKIKTYKRNIDGQFLNEQLGEKLVLKLGKQEISFNIPKSETPQAYDAVIIFTDTNNNEISNPITAHYVIQGKSSTIENLRLDKDFYKPNEKAKISFYWMASADFFQDSRGKGTNIETALLSMTIVDKNGNNCTGEFQQEIDENKIDYALERNIEKECLDPKVSVKLAKDNMILDENTFAFKSHSPEIIQNTKAPKANKKVVLKSQNTKDQNKKIKGKDNVKNSFQEKKSETNKDVFYMIGIILIGILLIILVLKRRKKTKKKGPKMFMLFLLIGAFFTISTSLPVFADTFTGRNIYGTIWYTIDLNKRGFSPGETIYATGSATGGRCGNGTQYVRLDGETNNTWQIFFDKQNEYADPYVTLYYVAPVIGGGYNFLARGYTNSEYGTNNYTDYNYQYNVCNDAEYYRVNSDDSSYFGSKRNSGSCHNIKTNSINGDYFVPNRTPEEFQSFLNAKGL